MLFLRLGQRFRCFVLVCVSWSELERFCVLNGVNRCLAARINANLASGHRFRCFLLVLVGVNWSVYAC